MDREKLAEMFRQRQAGFEAYHRIEIELAKKATFEDRVRGFLAIAYTGAALGWLNRRRDFGPEDYPPWAIRAGDRED
jgi:hypothetical protein